MSLKPVSDYYIGAAYTGEVDYELKNPGKKAPNFDPSKPANFCEYPAGYHDFVVVENGVPRLVNEWADGEPNFPGKRKWDPVNRHVPVVHSGPYNVSFLVSSHDEAVAITAEAGGNNLRLKPGVVDFPGYEVKDAPPDWGLWVCDIDGQEVYCGELIDQRNARGDGYPGEWKGTQFVFDPEPNTYTNDLAPLSRPVSLPNGAKLVVDNPNGQIAGRVMVDDGAPGVSPDAGDKDAQIAQLQAQVAALEAALAKALAR